MSGQTQRLRQREQRESVRREILAAADAFLRENPHRELTVDAVMAQTGLTRTAFYRHFDDVTDLLLRLLEQLGEELYGVADRWDNRADDADESAAHEGLAAIVDFYVAHGRLVRAVADAAASDEQIERAYRATLELFVEKTMRVLDRRVAAGQLRVPDTRAVARALNLMNEAYLRDAFGGEVQADRDVALTTLETVWLRSVGPGAGIDT